jgi:hypothetical protein
VEVGPTLLVTRTLSRKGSLRRTSSVEVFVVVGVADAETILSADGIRYALRLLKDGSIFLDTNFKLASLSRTRDAFGPLLLVEHLVRLHAVAGLVFAFQPGSLVTVTCSVARLAVGAPTTRRGTDD